MHCSPGLVGCAPARTGESEELTDQQDDVEISGARGMLMCP